MKIKKWKKNRCAPYQASQPRIQSIWMTWILKLLLVTETSSLHSASKLLILRHLEINNIFIKLWFIGLVICCTLKFPNFSCDITLHNLILRERYDIILTECVNEFFYNSESVLLQFWQSVNELINLNRYLKYEIFIRRLLHIDF